MPLKEALQRQQHDLRDLDEEEARQVADRTQEIVSRLIGTEHEKTHQQVADFLLTGWSMNPILLHSIDALELRNRLRNALKQKKIAYIGDLAQRTEEELRSMPCFGPIAIKEIKQVLAEMHLPLGMKIDSWPPVGLPYE